MKIIGIRFDEVDNPGCNNGNYIPFIAVAADTGKIVAGVTCNCLAGCSGTDRLIDYENQTAFLIRGSIYES